MAFFERFIPGIVKKQEPKKEPVPVKEKQINPELLARSEVWLRQYAIGDLKADPKEQEHYRSDMKWIIPNLEDLLDQKGMRVTLGDFERILAAREGLESTKEIERLIIGLMRFNNALNRAVENGKINEEGAQQEVERLGKISLTALIENVEGLVPNKK